MALTVILITPEKSLPPAQADHVTLPGFDGEIGIRPGHAAFVCQLGTGSVRLKSATKADATYLIRGGVAQVLKDEVRILAESIAETMDEARLVKQIIELSSKDYDDPAERAQARSTAHWAAVQLKTQGKAVPSEAAKLGL